MALNSILSQLNGLRAGYGGQPTVGPTGLPTKALEPFVSSSGASTMPDGGWKWGDIGIPNPYNNNGMGGVQQPATFNYTGPMQTGLNGLYARPGQLENFMTGPTQKPSYANAVNSSASPSWFDASSYTPTAREWPTGMPTPTDPLTGQPVGVRGLGTISPKATQRVGLLPSGTDLNNQALFGSLNPGMGWAPSWSEIADAWGSSGQVPIDYMLPYAKDHTARQVTEMLGSGASAADVWSKEGERLLKDFFNPKVPKDLNKAKGQTAYDAALAQWMASQPEMRFALK